MAQAPVEVALDRLGPIHNSHLTAVRRCGQKFQYAFIEGIQPKLPGLPLARGIWLHYCLEAQFLRWGIDAGTLLHTPEFLRVDGVGEVSIEDSQLVVLEAEGGPVCYDLSAAGMLKLLIDHVWSRLFEAEQEKYTEDGHDLPSACQRILTEYFYYWKDEERPEVLLVEVEWQREYKGVTFEGRSDYVVRRQLGSGQKVLVCGDWKSTKNQPPPFFKFMESQLNLYPWGLAPTLSEYGISDRDLKIMAAEFDYLATKLPTTPSINQDGSVSKRKINTTYLTLKKFLKENRKKWTEEEIQEYLARNERVFFMRDTFPRNKKVVQTLLDENVADAERMAVLLADPSKITRTVTRNCDWDCDFQPICQGELYGQNVSNLRKMSYEPRSNSHAGVVEKDD